jgi:type II secretory pathway pseudopilin PulG
MAFCAWCGNHVPAVSYAPCARCGNPTNGAQRVAGASSSGTATGLIIGLLVGGVVLVAVIGILAAIAIPNLMTATQRSKQKRTIADLRSLSTAVEAHASEKDQYPAGTMDDLAPALSPVYMKSVPRLDGWGTPIRYECWPAGACTSYALASAGGDKTFEHDSLQEYTPGPTTNFDNDLVLSNGKLVRAPEEMQKGVY